PEDQRAGAVSTRRLRGHRGGDEPAPVLGAAKQRRKARLGVEAGKAAPVERALAVDERRRLQVGQERVVLEERAHRLAKQTSKATPSAVGVPVGPREIVRSGPEGAGRLLDGFGGFRSLPARASPPSPHP